MTSKLRLKASLEMIKASGKISSEALVDLSLEERKLVQSLYEQDLIIDSLDYMEVLDNGQGWAQVKEQLTKVNERPYVIGRKTVPLWRSVMKYAAILIGVAVLGYVTQFQTHLDRDLANQITDIQGIRLLLENGEMRILPQNLSQEISNGVGNIVAKHNGQSIKYLHNPKFEELVFHEIEVPYGKMFDIELSDGTIVHLNSGSKMRYPIQFIKGQNREVSITGEGYFEVVTDKAHPFVVNSDDMTIEVLGTKFNISTYKDERAVEAVLVEGSIKMTNPHAAADAVILTPGTRGYRDKYDQQTRLENVDVNIYTSWLKGELVFKNSNFGDILKKLERKYDVQIENKNMELSQKVFNASFNKDVESIDDVIKYFADAFYFQYEIINNQIFIY